MKMIKFLMISLLSILCLSHPVFAEIKTVASLPDLAYITKQIGGNKVSVFSLAKGYQDPHQVDLKPSFMLKLSEANFFVLMGLELEVWARDLIEGSRNVNLALGAPGYVDCSEGINVLEVPSVVSRSMGDVHPLGNPHYNLDPLSGKTIARNIYNALVRQYPQFQDYFKNNLENFDSELDKNFSRWIKEAAPLKGLKVITYHKSWEYFAHRFGIDIVGQIEPKPGIPPSPAQVTRVIELMNLNNAKIIIMEPYFDDHIPNLIASKTGAKVLKLPNMVGAFPGEDSYFSMFDYIISHLTKAAEKG